MLLPKKSIVHVPANALDRFGNLRLRGGLFGSLMMGQSAEEVILDSYSETNVSAYAKQYAGFNENVGQALNLPAAKTLTAAEFYLRKTGSPTGTVTVRLKAATGTVGTDATPTGAALASGTFDISTLTASGQWIKTTFSTPYSAASGDYAIETVYTGGASGTDLEVGRDESSPTHAGNAFYATTDGGAYAGQSTVDYAFRLYGY